MAEKFFDPHLSLRLAHGMEYGTTSTRELFRQATRVKVPIAMDVMRVRDLHDRWADVRSPAGLDGQKLKMPDPFSTLPSGLRPPGAYLHWAVPDGLTHGRPSFASGQTTGLGLWTLPDRWLIARASPSSQSRTRRRLRTWVLTTDGPKTQVSGPLAGWKEPGPNAGRKATAWGPGDPAWTCVWDNVRDRFGFYDDLQDVPQGEVSYLVCGWYADERLDPLNLGIAPRSARRERLRQLGWAPADPAPSGEAAHDDDAKVARIPAVGTKDDLERTVGCFFHSMVVNVPVGFPVDPREMGGPPAASEVRTVVAPSLVEAIATLLADDQTPEDEARVLEAFVLGGLDELEHPDGEARLEARLHDQGFQSWESGKAEWEPEATTQGVGDSMPAPPKAITPGVFGKREPPAPSPSQISPLRVAPLDPIVTGSAKYKAMSGGMVDVRARLELGNAQKADPGDTGKRSLPLPRWYAPNDPVIALAGAGRTFRAGGDGRYDLQVQLVVRDSGIGIRGIVAKDPGRIGSGRLVLGRELFDGDLLHSDVPADCQELLDELGALDPAMEEGIARLSLTHDLRMELAPMLGSPVGLSPGALMLRDTLLGDELLVLLEDAQKKAAQKKTANAPPSTMIFGFALRSQDGADLGEHPSLPLTRALSAGTPVEELLAPIREAVRAEQSAWWALRDPRVAAAPFLAYSGLEGMLPSHVGFKAQDEGWSPLYLEWEVRYVPTAGGAQSWAIDETELTLAEDATEVGSDAKTWTGRGLLSASATRRLADAVVIALRTAQQTGDRDHLPARAASSSSPTGDAAVEAEEKAAAAAAEKRDRAEQAVLSSLKDGLEQLDVLTCSLAGLHPWLAGEARLQGLRAGHLEILRLRVIDGFGRYVDVQGARGTRIEAAPSIATDTRAKVRMPPRLLGPSKLRFRFMRGSGIEGVEADPRSSPICGWLLPDHLDGGIEVFDAEGANLGSLRPVSGMGVVWDCPPGWTGPDPSPTAVIRNPVLAGIVQGLRTWGVSDADPDTPGVDTALSAILRTIDATMWTVDPFGSAGEEHHALLVGHPIAVVRAEIGLEVMDALRANELGAFCATNFGTAALPVRLGALAHWQDGLLGYFVDDDYGAFHPVDAAAAALARELGPRVGFLGEDPAGFYAALALESAARPVVHRYVTGHRALALAPGQTRTLTLLVEPHCAVHATCGALPRKSIELLRDWTRDPLSRLAPTFRFGPVLVDPRSVRMPVTNERDGSWTWDHRKNVVDWTSDAIAASDGSARLGPDPVRAMDGWLVFHPGKEG